MLHRAMQHQMTICWLPELVTLIIFAIIKMGINMMLFFLILFICTRNQKFKIIHLWICEERYIILIIYQIVYNNLQHF